MPKGVEVRVFSTAPNPNAKILAKRRPSGRCFCFWALLDLELCRARRALRIVGMSKSADPAIASGSFVTTITDLVGFFSFLGFAAIWFGLG
ncbi:MAG: hypothetical protein P0Y66_17770 [Candidatus Kaistia colombiensis]|nr:MAG: hypothetical protein P0Y66_17770 [Kaistia sp.]